MADPILGKLVRVDPRSVWTHEAINFTPWLAEHIDQLGEALGLELELSERECAVGDFAVDLVARDLGRDRVVVIENQLEQTDHRHLGQLITYAAGLEAGVVIWVSRDIREEHRQALDWLNRGDANATEYFGVVLELLQIDGSRPAVSLRVVVSPNNWSRDSMRVTAPEDVSGKRARYQQFFQGLIDELREKHRFTNARRGQPQNWYSFSSGTRGFQYSASFATDRRLRCELYIDMGVREANLAALEHLQSDRSVIESAFGEPLEWDPLEGRQACTVRIYGMGAIEDSTEALEDHHRWMVDHLLRLKRAFGDRLPDLGTKVKASIGTD
jgi:hypothetical protein